jgi:hypothetical protein
MQSVLQMAGVNIFLLSFFEENNNHLLSSSLQSEVLLCLSAKIQGKYVGIPICEGAAMSKSPWDEPYKLFHHGLSLHMILMNTFTNR